MKLISVIPTLNPAYGGPAECARQLYRNVTSLGHSYDAVTLDDPKAEWNKNLPFEPICLGKKTTGMNPVQPALIRFLRQNQSQYDGSILHGIWTFANVAMRLAWNGIHRYVIFPHGMLDPYFIRNFPVKHIKKSVYYRAVAAPLMANALATLFTCDEEKRLADSSYRPVVGRREVVRYGIAAPQTLPNFDGSRLANLKTDLKGKEVILFLGRIHPKKGCDLLIEAMARLAHKWPRAHVVIAGPDETGSALKLKQLAATRGIQDRITWVGPAFGDERWFLYDLADVFILPSHMENFGMTVAESLSQGVPVLTTDKVNIYSSILKAGAGFVRPDTLDGVVALLDIWHRTSSAERSLMGESARRLFEQEFQAAHTATDLLHIFESTGAAPPDCLPA